MRLEELLTLGQRLLTSGLILTLIIVGCLFIGYQFIYKKLLKGSKKLNLKKLGLWLILFCYLVVVIGATLGRHGIYQVGAVTFHPFSSYINAWNTFSFIEWRNLILNICMFIPIGILLPIVSHKLRVPWKTYLIGFLLTLAIESTQFITKRGIFEVDDLINNFLGCLIGYGLFVLGTRIWESIFKKEQTQTFKHILLTQLPLCLTAIAFTSVFISYSLQELGNLSINPIYPYDMSNVTFRNEIEFSTESHQEVVYSSGIATQEQTLKIANDILSLYETSVDETETIIYDDVAVYRSLGGDYSVWVDFVGCSFSFTDFTTMHDPKKSGLTAEEVYALIKPFSTDLPQLEQLSFTDEGDGIYYFEASMVENEDHLFDGKLRINVTRDLELDDYTHNMIKYEPYKEFEIMSEQEAFNKLQDGAVNLKYYHEKISTIEIKQISLKYMTDSKGFYQPVYVIETLTNNEPYRYTIAALK